jgi:homoaconitase/3-isopropylmalate dehydratase large subunit
VSIGRPATKADLDQAAGAIAISLFATMDNIAKVKSVLDTLTVTDLQALGYSSNEANQLKSAFTDLDKIRTVFLGTATQATTYDFRTFAKLLLGTGLY